LFQQDNVIIIVSLVEDNISINFNFGFIC